MAIASERRGEAYLILIDRKRVQGSGFGVQ